jgi:hypothetical protein
MALAQTNHMFWGRPGEPLSPTAGAGQAAFYAFAESDSFLLRGENRNHRIPEDPAGIEVWLGEIAIAGTGPIQSFEMSQGFEDTFASEAYASASTISV